MIWIFLLHASWFGISHSLSVAGAAEGKPAREAKAVYRCPMHPTVRLDHPGECPICHMRLEKVRSQPQAAVPNDAASQESGVQGRATIHLSPEQLKLSGTSSVAAERHDLVRELRVPGRVIGGGQISFQVFEQDLADVRPGLAFEAEAPSLPGERLSGKIHSIESILDPMTRTARVNGSLSQSPRGGLRVESSVSGRIRIQKSRVLVIPETAILPTGERHLVYVSDGQGGFNPRSVRLGPRGGGMVEVLEGLKEGEKVSSGPNFLIDSESKIQGSYDSSDH